MAVQRRAARVTKASGDEGIDGVINEDRLGLMSFMCKRNAGKIPLDNTKFCQRWQERKLRRDFHHD